VATAQQVPSGTVADLTAWMGDDPARAQAVINSENASGSPRSTLVAAAEGIVASHPQTQEEAVSEQTTTDPATDPATDEEGPTFEEMEPRPPATVTLNSGQVYTGSAVEVFPPEEGDPPDPASVDILAAAADSEEPVDLEAEPVTSLQVVAATSGCILAINGTGYSFTGGQTAVLGRLVQQASATVY